MRMWVPRGSERHWAGSRALSHEARLAAFVGAYNIGYYCILRGEAQAASNVWQSPTGYEALLGLFRSDKDKSRVARQPKFQSRDGSALRGLVATLLNHIDQECAGDGMMEMCLLVLKRIPRATGN